MPRMTPVVKVLLIINIGIFALQVLLKSYLNVDLVDIFALRYFGAETFAPYQLLTHMFLHDMSSFFARNPSFGSIFHLLGNMYALYIFGPPLETYFDSKKFLALYMIAGLGAAVLHVGVSAWEVQNTEANITEYKTHPTPAEFLALTKEEGVYDNSSELRKFVYLFEENPTDAAVINRSKSYWADGIAYSKRNIKTVGASGAVFGILAAFGIIFANIKLVLLFPPIPIKAKYLVFGYALYEVYAIYQANPTDNVAHFAHIGGFIFGIILVKLWGKNDKPMRWN
ncbi:rhomboid family intramembrane serine protease [Bernardetia sp. OM2101]|uniref:rhomboid family intramembrane serine protease n=1 Tax=Bernardetia sp. OM2101 TaxID=3344876 RepID=UPI0035D12679